MEPHELTGGRVIPADLGGPGVYLEQVARYRLAARLAEGKRVLDAATGAGYGAALLADALAAQVIGIDIDRAAIERARQLHSRPNLEFRVDDATRLTGIPDGTVEFFVSFETIEHLERGEDLVRQAGRVLTPAGVFLLSTPNGEVGRRQNPLHKREYRREELIELLRAEFPHVELFDQRTFFASQIAPADRHGGAPPAVAGSPLLDAPGNAPGGSSAPTLVAFASRAAIAVTGPFVRLGEAADTGEKNRTIQNLEGRIGERDARLRDLEIALDRREMRLAMTIARGLIRVNRIFGHVPSRLARRLLRAGRIATGAAPPPPRDPRGPLFSLIVPVRLDAEHLEASIESALGQSFDDTEILLYYDASPDPLVRAILEKFRSRPRVRIHTGERGLGVWGATNAAIALARGRYVAFLDRADLLERDALERVARRLEQDPGVAFLYTNRVDVDEAGRVVEPWDFTNRSPRPDAELPSGMFAVDLKVIRRSAFLEVGLFRGELETAADFDMALRLSERCRVALLGEALYGHRVQRDQATESGLERQRALAERVKDRALLRRRIAAGGYEGLVSIVILSLDRPEETSRCLDAIARHTPFRHEIVLVDNASQPPALERLRAIVAGRGNVTLHELPKNLGVGGGRNHGASLAGGDYLVFLDNDIEVGDRWLAHLLVEMEGEPRLAACCCRVVFPDGTVQFTAGGTKAGARRIRFELLHTGRSRDDLATLERRECDWVPGGATIFRKSVFDSIPYDTTLEGAYEDNDWSIAARGAGHLLGNAPLATVVHHQVNHAPAAQGDEHYRRERYDKGKLERTLRRFHQKHGLFIDEEDLYRYLGYSGSDAFIEGVLAGQGGRA